MNPFNSWGLSQTDGPTLPSDKKAVSSATTPNGSPSATAKAYDAQVDENPYCPSSPSSAEDLKSLYPPSAPSTNSILWEHPNDSKTKEVNRSLSPEEATEAFKVLETKLRRFHVLKAAEPPTHYNESLLRNRSFRNPHIHDRLVSFVGINERLWGRESTAWLQASRRSEIVFDSEQSSSVVSLAEKLAEEQRKYEEDRTKCSRGRIEFAPGTCDSEDAATFLYDRPGDRYTSRKRPAQHPPESFADGGRGSRAVRRRHGI